MAPGLPGTSGSRVARAIAREPYFARRPPKSTGRDLFNEAWLRARLSAGADARVVQATLLELSAQSIADAVARECRGRNGLSCAVAASTTAR